MPVPQAPTILEVLCHEAQFRALDPPALHDTLPLYCATDPAPAVVQAAVAAMLEAGLLRRTDAGRLAVTLFGYQACAGPLTPLPTPLRRGSQCFSRPGSFVPPPIFWTSHIHPVLRR